MKKILLIGILGLIISSFTITASSQTLFEHDFSTPDGWKFTKNITSGTNNSEVYDSSIHTTVSFSDGTMKVGGDFFAHKFVPETYTTGVLEANFKMKPTTLKFAKESINTAIKRTEINLLNIFISDNFS